MKVYIFTATLRPTHGSDPLPVRWTIHPFVRLAILATVAISLSGCEYVRLLRPGVLKQLNPRVVRLVNYLPEVDDPNKEIIARLIGHGGLVHAKEGRDGVFRATIRVPPGEYIWQPAVVAMPRGGELELDFYNEDPYSHHAATLPSVADKQLLMLPVRTRGRARVRLDQPGMYSFDCPVANHAGRGMVGLILVGGEVPPEAKLDRPRQPRP